MNQKYNFKIDLSDLYNWIDDPEIEEDIKKLDKLSSWFESKYKWKVKNFKEEDFLQYFQDLEYILQYTSKIWTYLNICNILNTQDEKAKKKKKEYESFYNINIFPRFKFFSEESESIWDKKLYEFSKAYKLQEYKNWFNRFIKFQKYKLPKEQENILKKISNSDLIDFYNDFKSSIRIQVNIEWKRKNHSISYLSKFIINTKDYKLKKKVYDRINKEISKPENKTAFYHIFYNIVKNRCRILSIRWYENVMWPNNLTNDIDQRFVEFILNKVKSKTKLLQDFYKLKAKKLNNKSRLDYFLTNENIYKTPNEIDANIWIDYVLKSLKKFDKDFYDYAKFLFDNKRIDLFPNENKKKFSGLCFFYKNIPTYILLNYHNASSIKSISHELWHAIHGFFAQNNSSLVYHPCEIIKEIPSTFNEILFLDYMSKNNKEYNNFFREELVNLIIWKIFVLSIRTEFELSVHEDIFNWKHLSLSEINKKWYDTKIKYYSNSVSNALKDSDDITWVKNDFFFERPFSQFNYIVSILISFILYQKYQKEWNKFIEKYKEFLSYGWSLTTEELLKIVWINLNDENVFEEWFDIIYNKVHYFS